jgi:two-component system, NarL family, sensor histidine kinase DesK
MNWAGPGPDAGSGRRSVTGRCDNDQVSDAPIDTRTGLTGIRRYTWWTLAGTAVFFLVREVGQWMADPDPPVVARVVGGVALTVTVVAAAVLLTRRLAVTAQPAGRLPEAWLVAGGAAAATLGGVLLADRYYELWSYAPATIVSIAATFLPARQRWVLIVGAAAGAAALGGVVALVSGDGVVDAVAYPAGLTALIAWVTLGLLWSWDVAERLDDARRLAAELAVKEERLRFAADLHDIQGHHLQVIALKSELAARLVGRDPARATAEMEDVRRVATDAIEDTRAVVQGYRRTTLDDEIANATRVMTAADIDARMTILGPAAPAGGVNSRHLLGLVVREATTNVLRHSRARHAEVDYRVSDGQAHLRVSNDGVVDPAAGIGESAGTGLRSLAERLAAAGGQLTWSQDGDRFVVAASLPVTASAPGEAG